MPFFHDPEDAFWSKVDRTGECWEWRRAVDPQGCGALKVGRKKVNAHRYSYELHYGAIPPGMLVCHRCNNRLCVRPDHLYLGSHRDNYADMVRAGTAIDVTTVWDPARPGAAGLLGEASPNSVLTENDVLEIYQRLSAGETPRKLAAEFGVGRKTVYDILRGRSWSWLTGAKKK